MNAATHWKHSALTRFRPTASAKRSKQVIEEEFNPKLPNWGTDGFLSVRCFCKLQNEYDDCLCFCKLELSVPGKNWSQKELVRHFPNCIHFFHRESQWCRLSPKPQPADHTFPSQVQKQPNSGEKRKRRHLVCLCDRSQGKLSELQFIQFFVVVFNADLKFTRTCRQKHLSFTTLRSNTGKRTNLTADESKHCNFFQERMK